MQLPIKFHLFFLQLEDNYGPPKMKISNMSTRLEVIKLQNTIKLVRYCCYSFPFFCFELCFPFINSFY